MTPASLPLRLYRGITRLGLPLIRLHLARRVRRGKEDAARLGERFGKAAMPRPDGRLVWVHAASIGEALSALPLIERIQAEYPQAHVLMTTGTVTSASLIARRAPHILHQFVPVDAPQAVTRFLDHWRPDLAIWMESELWPNLVLDAAGRGIPMVLANARLSEKSARGWKRAPSAIAALLGAFRLRLAQTGAIRERLIALGASPAATPVTGDLKASRMPEPLDGAALAALKEMTAGRPLWLAASTHPGDEDCVLAAHEALSEHSPNLLTIIAPRHPERGPVLAAAAEARGIAGTRRALGGEPTGALYIADTLGEMALWYALAPVALIGGGWDGEGGHNPLEAAERGAAILSGGVVQNFEESYARLTAAGATRLISRNELAGVLGEMLSAGGQVSATASAMREAAHSQGAPDPLPLEHAMKAMRPLLAEALA